MEEMRREYAVLIIKKNSEDGGDRFSRNVGKKTTILRCVKYQKSELNNLLIS